jgi:hypothetical protein
MKRKTKMENILENLSWSCHICKVVRPDAKISVRSTTKLIGDNPKEAFEMQTNVRYCNDNPTCIEKSKTHTFFKKEGSNL